MQTICVTCTDAIAKMCAPIPTTDTHRKHKFVVRVWGPFFGPLCVYALLFLLQFWARFWFLKWAPTSNWISCCRSPFCAHLGDHICTTVCFVGGDGRPSGRPLLHKSFHPGFPKISPNILDVIQLFLLSQSSVFLKNGIVSWSDPDADIHRFYPHVQRVFHKPPIDVWA